MDTSAWPLKILSFSNLMQVCISSLHRRLATWCKFCNLTSLWYKWPWLVVSIRDPAGKSTTVNREHSVSKSVINITYLKEVSRYKMYHDASAFPILICAVTCKKNEQDDLAFERQEAGHKKWLQKSDGEVHWMSFLDGLHYYISWHFRYPISTNPWCWIKVVL